MKVFIGWSGDQSKCIAEAFREWLPSVLQAVQPYFSPDDIAKGTRWNSEIAKELSESKVGLFCLTPDNLSAPWLMFEAGALSKSLDKSKVCPILYNVEPTDLKGPLVQFQAARFQKDEIFKVVKMINSEQAESALPADVLTSVFEMWWPKLEKKIKDSVEGMPTEVAKAARSDRDLLEEVLTLVRRSPRARIGSNIDPRAVKDLLRAYVGITEWIIEVSFSGDQKLEVAIGEFGRGLRHVMNNTGSDDEAFELFAMMKNKFIKRIRSDEGDGDVSD